MLQPGLYIGGRRVATLGEFSRDPAAALKKAMTEPHVIVEDRDGARVEPSPRFVPRSDAVAALERILWGGDTDADHALLRELRAGAAAIDDPQPLRLVLTLSVELEVSRG